MSAGTSATAAGSEQQLAALRSQAYLLFAEAFEYPEAERAEAVREGALRQALCETLRGIDPALAEAVDGDALADAGADDELAVEFTRLFDVGVSGPPCPLYGGVYGGARMKTMEEALRFYHHFGLAMSESQRELPDHLATELEFLHFLAYREAQAIEQGEDPGPYQRAQRDFVARHPGGFVPKLRSRLEKQEPMRFFRELVRSLEAFLEHDRRALLARAGPPPPGGKRD